MLNPIARARGGIASESAANKPGPKIANEKEISALKITATHTVGAKAKPTTKIEAISEESASKRRINPGLRETNLTPTVAPTAKPTSCAGSVDAAIIPRARSSIPKTSS